MTTTPKRVVIVGGGCGGVQCARTMLSVEHVSSFVEPAPYILHGDATFEEALAIFATHHADTVYIVDDDNRVAGVITRSDLFRVVDLVAVRPIAERGSVSIRSLMSPDPIVMTMDDTAAAAALAMWSRGLKSLPVVTPASGQLVGCIRAETVMQAVLRRVARQPGLPVEAPVIASGPSLTSV